MASVESITEAELIDALALAAKGNAPKNAKTVEDFVRETGIGKERIRKAIGRLAMENRIQVHRVHRPDISGRPSVRPAYTILSAQGKRT